ncbi:MAG: UbiH/UbiF/VisC/COQ6 family ubiquinone biosynthesis hydroxylase [Alphaproteobacteria bacterium]
MRYDVVIVGGGLVGMSLACALAGAGVSVGVVDREAPSKWQQTGFDGRASAITYGSQQVLAGIGLWPLLDDQACPIKEIRVSDQESPLFLHYDHGEIGDNAMGFMVENRVMRGALMKLAGGLDKLDLHAPAVVETVRRDGAGVGVSLADGGEILARVLFACDGRNSMLRARAGITVTRWDYEQSGIVCTVTHEHAHRNIAHERFLSAGPFAILPLLDDWEGRHLSSIVWTERRDLAPAIMALDESEFTAELARRFGDFLGEVALVGQRWCYPLGLLHADRYTSQRLALVGDAAHAIHPIAGQGLNMGLRDVAALAEAVVDARRLGLDVGSETVLERYERWRRFDNTLLMIATDGLNRLFSNDVAPIRLGRDLGLAAVNALPPLRRLFMRHAMGVVGTLPRLARGELL